MPFPVRQPGTVIVWLWDSSGPARNGRGVSDDEMRARQAAEACITSGADVARVEKAVTELGIRTLTSGYQRTREEWLASHCNGRVTWVRAS